MPVEGDVLVALIVDVDDDDVARARVDGRAGELAVHGQDGLLVAEPGDLCLLYLQNMSHSVKTVACWLVKSWLPRTTN